MGDIVSERVTVLEHDTGTSFGRKILLSALSTTTLSVNILIGSVGKASIPASLKLGEFVIFERDSEEIYEIRLMTVSSVSANFLISRLSPSHIVGQMSRLNERILWADGDANTQKFSQQEAEFMKAKLSLFENA